MTTVTFSRVFQTGMSFLGVSLAILGISGLLGSIGFSMFEDDPSDAIGIILLLISVLVLASGFIGLIQKLVSDAFLEGFKVARDSRKSSSGTRMGVVQTLGSGLQVIGIVFLSAIISVILFNVGNGMLSDHDGFSNAIGSLIIASGCAVFLAVLLGMLTMILAEGVFFGAKNSGVSFKARKKSPKSQTFKELDSDGDGSLSKEEVAESSVITEESFEEIDSDGDGSISEEEFDDFNFDFDDEEDIDSIEESEEAHEGMKKSELVELCKERGLSHNGTKAELLSRLNE